ncbi:hypothetical protein T440DRAFT_34704 [Plenodomus tracheiphilus IPT5]|uniref:Uncharacterized protein n=1 Tax=Plenodomus tracheiphilus IPT5 TaxID=1408161 RepID=A0A6A7BBL8_9PLEO|nr:hypothetical protein T440DRAFT_34704 [Plenodomus tracheiphilus IPT5]
MCGACDVGAWDVRPALASSCAERAEAGPVHQHHLGRSTGSSAKCWVGALGATIVGPFHDEGGCTSRHQLLTRSQSKAMGTGRVQLSLQEVMLLFRQWWWWW